MVYLFLADGFEEIEALTQVDYLRRAGIDIKMVGLTGEYATGTRGIIVKSDISINEVHITDETEMLILPGGLGGTNNIAANEKAVQMIIEAYDKGIYIAAICAAPTVFAKLGLLKNKKCVCYPAMLDELTAGGGIVCADKAVVKDGKIITAKAAGASEEFSFELIRTLKDSNTAEEVRASICAR